MKPNIPRVWAEADECGMVKLNIGPQALVISLQEVFSAPDPDGTIIRARRKVFAIATKIQAGDITTVILERRMKCTEISIYKTSKTTFWNVFTVTILDSKCVYYIWELSRNHL